MFCGRRLADVPVAHRSFQTNPDDSDHASADVSYSDDTGSGSEEYHRGLDTTCDY